MNGAWMIEDTAGYLAAVGLKRAPQAALSMVAAWSLRVFGSRRLIRLVAPFGLAVYATADQLESVVRNVLHIFYYKDYEVVPGFQPRQGWVIVDAGAFIGLYTLRAAKLAGPNGLVLAIEPQPEAYRLLRLNASANKLHNVRLLGACLAGGCGFADLIVPPSTINATLNPDYARSYEGCLRRVRVRAIPLDAVLSRLGYVDLLKMDIEGAELEVVITSQLLRPSVAKRVVVEVHPPFTKTSEIAQILEQRGYRTAVYIPEDAEHQAFVYAF